MGHPSIKHVIRKSTCPEGTRAPHSGSCWVWDRAPGYTTAMLWQTCLIWHDDLTRLMFVAASCWVTDWQVKCSYKIKHVYDGQRMATVPPGTQPRTLAHPLRTGGILQDMQLAVITHFLCTLLHWERCNHKSFLQQNQEKFLQTFPAPADSGDAAANNGYT